MSRSIARLVAAVLVSATPFVAAAISAGPSFDCAKARTRDEKLICELPEPAAMDRRVAEAYALALKRVPRQQAAKVRKAQREWIRGRASCAAPRDEQVPDRDAIVACIRLSYARRLSAIADLGASLPPAVERRAIKWSDARVEVDVSYPMLTGSAPGAKAFSRWSEQQARKFEARARAIAADPDVAENAKQGGLPSSVDVTFTVPLATPRILSVVFTGWEYPSGGAHGLPFRVWMAFDLDRARPLGEGDLFVPGGKERAAALVVAKLATYGEEIVEDLDPKKAAQVGGELSNWTFRADMVEVTFPVYSIASYGAGPIPVWLTYDELRPFLRPDAPLPSR